MNLRPQLAGKFADVILDDLRSRGIEPDAGARDRWQALILEHFESKAIPLPGGLWSSTYDETAIDLFLAKYPEIEPVLEYLRFATREVWPDARLLLTLGTEPELCSVCSENQQLVVYIHTAIGDAEDETAELRTDFNWSPNPLREEKYETLVFNGSPVRELESTHPHLVFVMRGFGDPDESVALEQQQRVDWEQRRRERARA